MVRDAITLSILLVGLLFAIFGGLWAWLPFVLLAVAVSTAPRLR